MEMFGHEHEGDQAKVVPLDGPVQALGEHPPPRVVDQQGHATITRESDLVTVAGFVAAADRLVMCRHRIEAIASSTGGQATSGTRLAVLEWQRGLSSTG